ncbi:hypothetical protein QR680_005975 [Steinernema hermaphroditum]|uniref:SRR1-like domain-containing protein n=1 Tax=Steinernema hermaphroditum TaxID=289476 RepID=A0AA39HV06_9BILA|nr:hypothetical protein QR680_005975 [Steinernema hermaphroditum]
MEEDGFQMYQSHKKKKKLPMMAPNKAQLRHLPEEDAVSVDTIEVNLEKAAEALERSGLIAKVSYFVEKILSGRRLRCIRGVGIGHFGQRPSSSGSLQMALFLAIRSRFQPPSSSCQDPVMSCDEIEYLRRIEVETPPVDDLSKSVEELRDGDVVLFFMPHCGHALYNNLLWSNWSSSALRNLVIIGNDFTKMMVLQKHEKEIEALLKFREIANVIAFPAFIEDAFSDTAVTSFSKETLPPIEEAKPKYHHFASELLLNKV